MPSIFDVARRAEVAIGTVSRVVNGDRHVASETRKRVMDAVKELGYRPNPSARALRTNRTNLIALTLPELVNPFYAAIVEGVQKELERADYHLILCGPPTTSTAEPRYLQLLVNRHVDGLIVASNRLSGEDKIGAALARLGRDGHPIVWLGGAPRTQRLEFDWIGTDISAGVRAAMSHLIEQGHRRIAYFGPPPGVAENRLATYREVLEANAIRVSPALIFHAEPTIESGFTLTDVLLKSAQRPTAILAVNDLVAVGAMVALQERDIAVPDEMSIIGVDDLPFASLVRPKLTTVSQPKYELGVLAAKRLLGRLAGTITAFERITLETKLVVRDSTCPPLKRPKVKRLEEPGKSINKRLGGNQPTERQRRRTAH